MWYKCKKVILAASYRQSGRALATELTVDAGLLTGGEDITITSCCKSQISSGSNLAMEYKSCVASQSRREGKCSSKVVLVIL